MLIENNDSTKLLQPKDITENSAGLGDCPAALKTTKTTVYTVIELLPWLQLHPLDTKLAAATGRLAGFICLAR